MWTWEIDTISLNVLMIFATSDRCNIYVWYSVFADKG